MKVFRKSLYAWIALLGIVFSQLALAAYACPLLVTPGGQQTAEMSADMAGMPCADMGMGMDTQTQAMPSALCVQHCDQGHQSVSTVQVPDFQPVLVLFLVRPPLTAFEPVHTVDLLTEPRVRTASTPPFLSAGQLRI